MGSGSFTNEARRQELISKIITLRDEYVFGGRLDNLRAMYEDECLGEETFRELIDHHEELNRFVDHTSDIDMIIGGEAILDGCIDVESQSLAELEETVSTVEALCHNIEHIISEQVLKAGGDEDSYLQAEALAGAYGIRLYSESEIVEEQYEDDDECEEEVRGYAEALEKAEFRILDILEEAKRMTDWVFCLYSHLEGYGFDLCDLSEDLEICTELVAVVEANEGNWSKWQGCEQRVANVCQAAAVIRSFIDSPADYASENGGE